ncbi:MAG: molybdopterin-dependent oxidoreductase [Actinomycetota bacterium]|nr:molybdopterin-dependent oxidoreductase [Actinomycetota bacterium]
MTAAGKHRDLVVWSRKPLNVETPLDLLARLEITPTELFYIRNHGAVPAVDAASYRLVIDGMVATPLALTLDDLRERFPTATVTATLACAGNRRAELAAIRTIPDEIPWGAGAIGTARWTGVRLRDILLATGVAPEAVHVAFTGLDIPAGRNGGEAFGGSIPLAKALTSDVLLAWAMNGEPLPSVHGFPLRVVVPGYVGARSVKWLSAVSVQASSSSSYFQRHAYRLFPPDLDTAADGAEGLELGELSVSSAISRLAEIRGAPASILADGYALTGGERTVERVDVSLDGGATWTIARLSAVRAAGVWRLWQAALDAGGSDDVAVVRAWDSAANTQPEDAGRIWNPKGYMNNAWHRTRVPAPAA